VEPQVVKTTAKHLFSAGNIAEFLKKHNIVSASSSARTEHVSDDILQEDRQIEEQSQSLLAADADLSPPQLGNAAEPSRTATAEILSDENPADTQSLTDMLYQGTFVTIHCIYQNLQ
jgi:hypothetical protein